MAKEEDLYKKIAASLEASADSTTSQMFGKPALKINGKAYACFFDNDMVFKLSGLDHKEAIALKGAKLFDPSGMGRAMKEWVQVPFKYKEQWEKFALAAISRMLK